MVRTQISMTEEQAEALRRLATLRRRSQAALMRDALDSLVDGEAHERRIARARSVIGRFRSDAATTTATADDHDAALADAFLT